MKQEWQVFSEEVKKIRDMNNQELLFRFVTSCENRDRVKVTLEAEYYGELFAEILYRMGGQ